MKYPKPHGEPLMAFFLFVIATSAGLLFLPTTQTLGQYLGLGTAIVVTTFMAVLLLFDQTP